MKRKATLRRFSRKCSQCKKLKLLKHFSSTIPDDSVCLECHEKNIEGNIEDTVQAKTTLDHLIDTFADMMVDIFKEGLKAKLRQTKF